MPKIVVLLRRYYVIFFDGGQNLKNLYLYYGAETHLIREAEKKLTAKLIPAGAEQMNLSVFEEKNFTAEELLYAAETLPFFNDRRLVVVRNAGFFSPRRKADSETLAEYLSSALPESTVLLIIEKEIDKRTRLYKKIAENGDVREFKPLSEDELRKWTISVFREKGKEIAPNIAALLMRTVSCNMEAIRSEADKLVSYCREKPVTAAAVNEICVKTIDARIFDLTDAIGEKRIDASLAAFHDMLALKEEPLVILLRIAGHFKNILQCTHLSNRRFSSADISQTLSLHSYVVKKCVEQGRYYSAEQLKRIIRDCLDANVGIVTGTMNKVLAVEMLVMKLIY
jgi:DNA polymerase-3 subunit delta